MSVCISQNSIHNRQLERVHQIASALETMPDALPRFMRPIFKRASHRRHMEPRILSRQLLQNFPVDCVLYLVATPHLHMILRSWETGTGIPCWETKRFRCHRKKQSPFLRFCDLHLEPDKAEEDAREKKESRTSLAPVVIFADQFFCQVFLSLAAISIVPYIPAHIFVAQVSPQVSLTKSLTFRTYSSQVRAGFHQKSSQSRTQAMMNSDSDQKSGSCSLIAAQRAFKRGCLRDQESFHAPMIMSSSTHPEICIDTTCSPDFLIDAQSLPTNWRGSFRITRKQKNRQCWVSFVASSASAFHTMRTSLMTCNRVSPLALLLP